MALCNNVTNQSRFKVGGIVDRYHTIANLATHCNPKRERGRTLHKIRFFINVLHDERLSWHPPSLTFRITVGSVLSEHLPHLAIVWISWSNRYRVRRSRRSLLKLSCRSIAC